MSAEVIVVIAFAIALDLMVMMFFIRKKRRDARAANGLKDMKLQEGWVREGTQGGELYRISGTGPNSIAWRMVAERVANNRVRTTWSTDSVRLNNSVLALGPGVGFTEMSDGQLDHPLVSKALAKMFGTDEATALQRGHLVAVGPEELSRNYLVVAGSQEEGERFVAEPVAELLIEWKKSRLPTFGAILWEEGVQVRFHQFITDSEQLAQAISLCELLALRGKEISGSRL